MNTAVKLSTVDEEFIQLLKKRLKKWEQRYLHAEHALSIITLKIDSKLDSEAPQIILSRECLILIKLYGLVDISVEIKQQNKIKFKYATGK